MKTTAAETPPAPSPLIERLQRSGRVEEFIEAAKARSQVHQRRRRRTRNTSLGALALVGFLAWVVPYTRETAKFATVPAQRSSVVLADGSRAELNANTEVFADFRYGRRTITLERGEAFFSVVSDPAHPFLVKTSSGTVRVTGTKFNVRDTPQSAEVTLLEGKVAFESAGQTTSLMPGQQLDSSSRVRALSADELANLTAWRQGRLALRGLTLAQVAGRLAAYHGCEITCSPEVADLRPGGNFALDDFAGFAEGLETILPVRVVQRGERRYEIRPR